MGFEVTNQMINDDKDLRFQLIVHAGDVSYAGVSQSWELEVGEQRDLSFNTQPLCHSTSGICGPNKFLRSPIIFPTWLLLVHSPTMC